MPLDLKASKGRFSELSSFKIPAKCLATAAATQTFLFFVRRHNK